MHHQCQNSQLHGWLTWISWISCWSWWAVPHTPRRSPGPRRTSAGCSWWWQAWPAAGRCWGSRAARQTAAHTTAPALWSAIVISILCLALSTRRILPLLEEKVVFTKIVLNMKEESLANMMKVMKSDGMEELSSSSSREYFLLSLSHLRVSLYSESDFIKSITYSDVHHYIFCIKVCIDKQKNCSR